MTKEELLKKAISLNDGKKYREAVEWLTDEVLNRFKDAELYNQKGNAHYYLNVLEKAIDEYSKAIEMNANEPVYYLNRGSVRDAKKEYDTAIEDYNNAIALNQQYYVAYYNRGLAWYSKKEYDKAIEDYNKVVELNPQYINAYTNRGMALYYKKEYAKAIEDYNKAIELDPADALVYNNRGMIWHDKNDYDNAIADYDKAIELNMPYPYAYSNRGLIWHIRNEYYKAIDDYNSAIAMDANYPNAYRSRGDAWDAIGEYTLAISDWERAMELDNSLTFLSYSIDLAKSKLGKPIETSGKTDEKSLYFLESQIEKLPEADKIPVRKMGVVLVDIADKIRKYAADTKNSEGVAHYTKLKVADLLVMKQKDETKTADENKAGLRYYNVVSMNDPEEGKTLLQYLTEEKDDSFLAKSFKEGQVTDENNIYLGSFLPAKDDIRLSHEDDLVMWRTYGKDENRNEAAGCSLVITLDFFSKTSKYIILDFEMLGMRGKAVMKEADSGQSLYQVLYYDKRKDTIIGDNTTGDVKAYLKQFKEQLELLVGYKSNDNKEIHEVINSLVYRFISEVRYFFKSADYSFENELRVIQYVSPGDERVKIDDSGYLPRGLYIESDKDIKPYLRKVILGPKVPNPERWMYLEVQMRKHGCNNFKVKPSICRYQ